LQGVRLVKLDSCQVAAQSKQIQIDEKSARPQKRLARFRAAPELRHPEVGEQEVLIADTTGTS
jgi:hypothetical protein